MEWHTYIDTQACIQNYIHTEFNRLCWFLNNLFFWWCSAIYERFTRVFVMLLILFFHHFRIICIGRIGIYTIFFSKSQTNTHTPTTYFHVCINTFYKILDIYKGSSFYVLSEKETFMPTTSTSKFLYKKKLENYLPFHSIIKKHRNTTENKFEMLLEWITNKYTNRTQY